jgi:hypothetical protein
MLVWPLIGRRDGGWVGSAESAESAGNAGAVGRGSPLLSGFDSGLECWAWAKSR